MKELSIDNERVTEKLCDFINSELEKAGFRSVVIGLSGGLDSSVSAYLATRALGRENVIGICMPYRTSLPESREDAHKVAEALNIRCMEIDISPMISQQTLYPQWEHRD